MHIQNDFFGNLISFLFIVSLLILIALVYRKLFRKRFISLVRSGHSVFRVGVSFQNKYHSLYETKVKIAEGKLVIIYCGIEKFRINSYSDMKFFDHLFVSGIIIKSGPERLVIYCHAKRELMDVIKKSLKCV